MNLDKQVKMGLEAEKEHHKNDAETRGIVMDHLKEIPDYYTRLEKMEKGAPQSNLTFKKALMNNPILAALKKRGKKDESKQHEAGESAEVEKTEPKDDAKAGLVKKLVALKMKKK